jgi:hypothetical protein
MDNFTLKELVRSRAFLACSLRRRFSIVRSLSHAISFMHGRGLSHNNLSPDLVFLDRYHEAKVQLFPFLVPEA